MKILPTFLLALTISLVSVINVNGQTDVLFKEEFSNVTKWKGSNSKNGSFTTEKEGDQTSIVLRSEADAEYSVIRDFSEFKHDNEPIKIKFDVFFTDKLRSMIHLGKAPNRIGIIGETNSTKLRLAGEEIKMADGAKFLTITPNEWNQIEIIFNPSNNTVQFILNGNDSQTVDLSKQPSNYKFSLNRFSIKATKGDSVKVKNIEVSKL